MPTVVCKFCRKKFDVYPSVYAAGGGKYCSRKCKKSSGCFTTYKHGDSKSRLYGIWCRMKLKKHICPEWIDNYKEFKTWAMANGYSWKLGIIRIDENGLYSPTNCKWTTKKQHSGR